MIIYFKTSEGATQEFLVEELEFLQKGSQFYSHFYAQNDPSRIKSWDEMITCAQGHSSGPTGPRDNQLEYWGGLLLGWNAFANAISEHSTIEQAWDEYRKFVPEYFNGKPIGAFADTFPRFQEQISIAVNQFINEMNNNEEKSFDLRF